MLLEGQIYDSLMAVAYRVLSPWSRNGEVLIDLDGKSGKGSYKLNVFLEVLFWRFWNSNICKFVITCSSESNDVKFSLFSSLCKHFFAVCLALWIIWDYIDNWISSKTIQKTFLQIRRSFLRYKHSKKLLFNLKVPFKSRSYCVIYWSFFWEFVKRFCSEQESSNLEPPSRNDGKQS